MAVTYTEKVAGTASSATTCATSGSLTPVAGNVYFAWVTNTKASTPDIPTLSGAGLTWDQVRTVVEAGTPVRHTLFRAQAAGGETPSVLTASFGGNTQTVMAVDAGECTGMATGANGATCVVQVSPTTDHGTGTTATANLATFADATNNLCLCGVGIGSNASLTNEAGFTNAGGATVSGIRNHMMYKTGGSDLTPSMTIGASITWGAIAVEVAIATAGGGLLSGQNVLVGGNLLTTGVLVR